MIPDGSLGVFVGAIVLGLVHGIEPGHGWPVAASYALDREHKWLSGLAASSILGIGHLISSIAMVAVFFWAKAYFDLAQINDPIVLFDGVAIGGPLGLVAGFLLVVLGIREYRHGHSHGHDHEMTDGGSTEADESPGHDHDRGHAHQDNDRSNQNHSHHDHSHHDHSHHDHDHSHHDDRERSDSTEDSLVSRILSRLPFVGGDSHDHGHDHPAPEDAADRGLLGIAGFAFVLGFAHEEEFEIIGLCLGSSYCLSLMLVYAMTVIVGIVGLTLLLIAGYERHEERVEAYAHHLPTISASVLIVMGGGFILGLF